MARLASLLHHLVLNLLLFSFFLQAKSLTTFCGSKPNGLYADPQNCYYFWKCWENGLKGSLLLCPPNTMWSQPSLTCINASNCSPSSLSNNHSSNCNNNHSSNCNNNSHGNPIVPIWSWNGLLNCYGEGCINTLVHSLDLGIPCHDAQELLLIAHHYTNAWVPAPHDVEDDLNIGGSQHWKIRFDSLEKEAESGLTLLKASIIDYSPSQKILSFWQGGPKEAQFVLKGPLASPQGGCYYGISLEKPDFNQIWEPFTQALIKERKMKEEAGLFKTQKMPMETPAKLFKRSHKRRSPLNEEDPTVQGCLTSVPWADLVATALCYASNIGINNIGPCSDFSSSDLFTLAGCFGALMGVNLNQGV